MPPSLSNLLLSQKELVIKNSTDFLNSNTAFFRSTSPTTKDTSRAEHIGKVVLSISVIACCIVGVGLIIYAIYRCQKRRRYIDMDGSEADTYSSNTSDLDLFGRGLSPFRRSLDSSSSSFSDSLPSLRSVSSAGSYTR